MPVSLPRLFSLLGPSTTAPSRTGDEPFSEPTRFATWCWGQSVNTVPSPMMNDEPHALAPSTFAEPALGEGPVGGFAHQLVVLGGHHRQSQAVGHGVGFGPREAEAEGVPLRLRDGALRASRRGPRSGRFGRFEPGGIALLAQRPHQFEVGQPRHVVEVEPFAFGARPRDVGAGPVGRLFEVIARFGVGQAGGQGLRSGERDRQLGRPQLEVVAPFGLGVEAVREGGQEVALRVGVRQFEDVLAGQQAARGEFGVAGREHLEAERERGRVAAGEVGADG